MQYRYVGTNPLYQGKTALATFASNNKHLFLVQFDEPTHDERGRPLHLGWHKFEARDWERVLEVA